MCLHQIWKPRFTRLGSGVRKRSNVNGNSETKGNKLNNQPPYLPLNSAVHLNPVQPPSLLHLK